MSRRLRIALLTCHLTGSGHFVRTLALARACMARGHEAMLISGGRPLPHIGTSDVNIVQLPPLVAEQFDYRNLRTPSGALATPSYMAARRAQVETALAGFAPHVLLTETYPFGRRGLRDEFEAAISTVGRATIMASVRDIPEPKPKRLDEVAERLRRGFDGVLVHGDATFIPLSASWPLPNDLMPTIHHTGYLGRDAATGPVPERTQDVLVAVGGGPLGRRLVAAAIGAALLSQRPWRVLAGGVERVDAPDNLVIEPPRVDYPSLLRAAACSISLCGYNTALDLTHCATPALLVPAAMGGDREQAIRAAAFASFEGFEVLAEDVLDPATLAATAERLARGPRRPRPPLRHDTGGLEAVRAIEAVCGRGQ